MSDEFHWPTRDDEDLPASPPTLAESQRALERTGSVTPPAPAGPPRSPPPDTEPAPPAWPEQPRSGADALTWVRRMAQLGFAVIAALIAIGIVVGDDDPSRVTDEVPTALPGEAEHGEVGLRELDPGVAQAAPGAVLAVAQMAADAGVPLPEDAFRDIEKAVAVTVAQGATPGEEMMSAPGTPFRRAMDLHAAHGVVSITDWYSLPLLDALRAAEIAVSTAPFCSARDPYSCGVAREAVTELVALTAEQPAPRSVDLGPSFEEAMFADDWDDTATVDRFFALLAAAGTEVDPEVADLMRAIRTPEGYAALPADFDEDRLDETRAMLNDFTDRAMESSVDEATFELVLAHVGAIRSAQDCRWRELPLADCTDLRADRYFAHRIVTDLVDAG